MRRRRDPAAGKVPKGRWVPTRRRRALRKKKRRALLLCATAALLISLSVLGLMRALEPSEETAALPELLAPEAFQPYAEFRSTNRVGTLFKAQLNRPPLDADPNRFAADMHAVAGLAAAAGYETVVVQAPDGTTLVTGSVDEPVVYPPTREGT